MLLFWVFVYRQGVTETKTFRKLATLPSSGKGGQKSNLLGSWSNQCKNWTSFNIFDFGSLKKIYFLSV